MKRVYDFFCAVICYEIMIFLGNATTGNTRIYRTQGLSVNCGIEIKFETVIK